MDSDLHVKTPLIESKTMSQLAGRRVYLKLENLQLGGSFKIRGIGKTMQEAVRNGAKEFVGSSGGNAGMAMAIAAKRLNKKLTVYIPSSTLDFMVDKLRAEGAIVVVSGSNLDEANKAAMEATEKDKDIFLVHPFNQSTTWAGHASIIEEVRRELSPEVPSCIVTAVGGGGLALGLLEGMDWAPEWKNVDLVTMETVGANCLFEARKAGELVSLPGITSIATSIGILQVEPTLLNYCLENPDKVLSYQVTDREAKDACIQFANEERFLVEPACGAALCAVYSSGVIEDLKEKLGDGPVVIIVCGGNIINLELLQEWVKEKSYVGLYFYCKVLLIAIAFITLYFTN